MFTSSEQIDEYLKCKKDVKTKSNRLRNEVVYARYTSSSLPKSNPVFRIFTTENKKRKMLTVDQFASNLKILLGKKKQRNSITLGDFQNALKC